MIRNRPWALWVSFLFLTIPFYRVVYFSDRALFFRDLCRDLMVQKMIWAQGIRSGAGIPFWNHFSLGGIPFWAMNVGSPLHPLNFLFLLFPQSELARALAFYLLTHYFLFFLGAFLLLRAFAVSLPIAALMATSLTLSGYELSLHSLGHTLASTVAVPWFFYFLRNHHLAKKNSHLLLLGACIGWPVYAGDPQFSYVLVHITLVFFAFLAKGNAWARVRSVGVIGLSSILASAAQLLPTLEMSLNSERFSMTVEEIVQFSFHPIRLLETLFPLFFGNRLGTEEFWGESLVNFPYKTPFIFSTYPGILVLFGLLLLLSKPRASLTGKDAWVWGGTLFFFLLCFGVFFPIPIYAFFVKSWPLFSLFRYPERMLFWPLFSLWFMAALALEKHKQSVSKNVWLACLIPLALGCLMVQQSWLGAKPTAWIALGSTSLGLLLLGFGGKKLRGGAWIGCLFFVQFLDLWFNQSWLVWDQSKYVGDKPRYKLATLISEDLSARKERIAAGENFHFSAGVLRNFQFNNSKMDHLHASTFTSFENLLPNVPALFGIEDVAGYYSFVDAKRFKFWRALYGPTSPVSDLRFFHNIVGAYYIPKRNALQEVVLETNPTAQPYLFIPARTYAAKNFEDALTQINAPHFVTSSEAVVEMNHAPAQKEERGNFRLKERNGKIISFSYFPKEQSGDRVLVLNESFDPHWHAKVNGKEQAVFRVNGWSMGTMIAGANPLEIEFSYDNPLIYLGLCLTAIWFLWLGFVIFRTANG